MSNSTIDPLLKNLQIELAERILYLAAFIDSAFGIGNSGVGSQLLELMGDSGVSVYGEEPERIDINKYRIGRALPFFYNYAYHARCIQGIQGIEWDDWGIDNLDQVFWEFLELTDTYGVVTSTGNMPDWGATKSSVRGESIWQSSPLWEMIKLCDARHSLDFEKKITIADIALLANMNEKSVRNALSTESDNKLHSEDGETVTNSEALIWLLDRKSGFRETTFVSFDGEQLPGSLGYMEIAPFIKSRLEKLYETNETSWVEEFERQLGYTRDQIWSIVDDVEKLPIKDTLRIAKAIKVDPVWFTEQVFSALFPQQMELILYKNQIEYEIVIDQQEKPFIEVTLTEKGIKNGYIDIPEKFSDFFPKDCFGDRATGKQGVPIELRFGTEVRSSDMRVKSSITISPRARFGGYFNKVIQAKPGDTLQIIRSDDRIFELKHIPKWTSEKAIMQLESLGFKPTNARTEKSKSAGFRIDLENKRHIAISCVTQNIVTGYINRTSISEQQYPSEGIDGIEVKDVYKKGHTGINGNPGIAGSVVRYNPSLDPSAYDVIRVHIDGSEALNKLLAWYTGHLQKASVT